LWLTESCDPSPSVFDSDERNWPVSSTSVSPGPRPVLAIRWICSLCPTLIELLSVVSKSASAADVPRRPNATLVSRIAGL